MKPTIREATAADADAIGRIQVETWRVAYAWLMPAAALEAASVEERQRLWRDGLSSALPSQRATFVAEAEGEVVGFASVGECREPGSEDGELYAIYLDQARWGQGTGRALLERAEESLRESGFADALLWVLDGNERAIGFYERAGWLPSGRKTDTFQGAEVVELGYRKRL
ncbi:MAG: GNAT family N-acetyltransferase [Actinomycetota bacterium]|nr:GNAT family N-acetyltransferase [Actinomycetota bacterium]